jgi:hypothetical protein
VRQLRLDAETVEWEALDTALDRPVVVQLLRPELLQDAAATERFWQVARTAARRSATTGERVLDGGTDPRTGPIYVVRELPTVPPPPPAVAVDESRVTPRAPTLTAPVPAVMARVPTVMGQLLSQFHDRPRWLVLSGVTVVLILAAMAVRPGVEGWLAWVNEPLARSGRSFGLGPAAAVLTLAATAPPTATVATRSAPPPTPSARATPVPTRATGSTPISTDQTRTVVNTDGRGVALRAAPGGDRLPGKGYDEGATVQALEQSGEWTLIQGPDGREGWVLTVTLAH